MDEDELRKGVEFGFINHNTTALDRFSPRLLVNDASRNEKILTAIKSELFNCDEFFLSVAFITGGGVSTISTELADAAKSGKKGKILASQYQNFTEPKALKTLLSLKNIEVKIVTEELKMHSKCYIFRHGQNYNIIIGSSNLTNNALCENKEWNLKISSTNEGEVTLETIKEFNEMFDKATPVDEAWLKQYSKIYGEYSNFRNQLEKRRSSDLEDALGEKKINPNKMQVEALSSIEGLRTQGKERALVISATGTGKTYLSAFDVKEYNPKRFLFIVHRETILNKSMESFRKVVGTEKKIGSLTGTAKDFDSDYLFAMIQTISQDHILSKFPKDYFDYIVIDEVHHAGAKTYQKIVNHFTPKFLLGMTATPERMDDFDIFEMFNHDIAYEIRLQQAMEYNLICPFHYFGISDLIVDGETIDNKEDFARLTSNERVNHIVKNIEYYSYCGNRVRGIMFCSRTDEARDLSEKFNKIGYRATDLNANTPQKERDIAIGRLEQEEWEGGLDYIFVVDLFNEGIDIPSVNQIVMLRPTESPIIFVQQLGRGLRHYDQKEYVVIIDFIGNYENNYMIPIALSGDRSYNKDDTRRFLTECNGMIPRNSVISFDRITKEKIFESIDTKNFSELKIIKEAYKLLKQKLGKIPRLTDFNKFGSLDAMKFIERFDSYHGYLSKYDCDDYKAVLSPKELEIIEYLSNFICSGKRIHELVFLETLISGSGTVVRDFKKTMSTHHEINISQISEENIINVFTGAFYGKEKQMGDRPFVSKSGDDYETSSDFIQMLHRLEFKDMVQDLLEFGWENYNNRYRVEGQHSSNFVLFKKYTYEDVCRLLDWKTNVMSLNIGGYKFDAHTNTFPIFINYVKGEGIVESQKYEDHFLNPSAFIAAPKSTDGKTSKNMSRVVNGEKNKTTIFLFIRKNKEDPGSKEFYYLGKVRFDRFIDKDNGKFMIQYTLENPVRQDIYDYITTGTE